MGAGHGAVSLSKCEGSHSRDLTMLEFIYLKKSQKPVGKAEDWINFWQDGGRETDRWLLK